MSILGLEQASSANKAVQIGWVCWRTINIKNFGVDIRLLQPPLQIGHSPPDAFKARRRPKRVDFSNGTTRDEIDRAPVRDARP
jgi:hypothetical protein